MEIKVELVGDKNVASSEKKSLNVETHLRRNDTFVIQKVDTVLQGESVSFTVPAGARLVVSTPEATEDMVYDREQGAAIRPSAQKNDEGKADAAKPAPSPTPQQRVVQNPQPPQPQVPTRQGPATPPPPRPQAPVPPVTPRTPAAQTTAPAPKPDASVGGAATRPPGEHPPLPGSPAGAPPAGNEGRDH